MNEQVKKSVVDLCAAVIRQPSVSGEEAGVVSELKAFMESSGFDSVTVDRYGSIIGCVKGNRPGPRILFDGHIDTVPVDAHAGPEILSAPRSKTAACTAAARRT